MRHYQPKKNNTYQLPHDLYMRMLYLVRDYDRMKKEASEIASSYPILSGQPSKNSISDPTGEKAVRLAAINRDCDAVDRALKQIPEEYRKGVIGHMLYKTPYPIDAGEATYKRWRCRFIYYVAKNLSYI